MKRGGNKSKSYNKSNKWMNEWINVWISGRIEMDYEQQEVYMDFNMAWLYWNFYIICYKWHDS